MVTATDTTLRTSQGASINPPLTLSLPVISPTGSPSSSNPAKEAFFLLDLLQVVKDVGTVFGKFKRDHGKDVACAGIKHVGVTMEALENIHSAGTTMFGG